MQVGDVPSEITCFTFGPKKVHVFAPVSPQLKIVQFSHWNLIDHDEFDNRYDISLPYPFLTL